MPVSFVFETGETLEIDASPAQGHRRSADATNHKVEEGADITDHVNPQPETVTISGIISYAPPRTPADLLSGSVALEVNRHIKAFERLEQAWEYTELMKVNTGLRVYEDVVIVDMDSQRTLDTGYDFAFTITFKQIRFAVAKTATVPKGAIAPGARQIAQRSARRGRRAKKSASAKVTGLLGGI